MGIGRTARIGLTTTERLVLFDTTSRNSNWRRNASVCDYLDRHGVTFRISTGAARLKSRLHAVRAMLSQRGKINLNVMVIPTIIYRPGDIARAHQPQEWIAEPRMAACDRVFRRLASRLLV